MTATRAAPAVRAREPLRVLVRRRSPADVRHLVEFSALLLLGLALATVADETMAGIEADLLEGFSRIPASLAGLVVAIVAVLYLVLILGLLVGAAVTRRWATLGSAVLGWTAASIGFTLLRGAVPVRTALLPEDKQTAFAETVEFPPVATLASYTALIVIVGVEMSRTWRRALWLLLVVLTLLQILTSGGLPLDVLLAIGSGGVVGTLVLVLLGRSVRVVSQAGVVHALTAAGLPPDAVSATDDEGPWQFRAVVQGRPLQVKVAGREDQQLDTLYRAYRRVRLRDVGDDTAYSSARRAVAVEALLTLFPAAHGVRSPTVRVIAPVVGDDVLLAVDEVPGVSLGDLPETEITDEVLRDCWRQVLGLRAARVAHRSLELRNFVRDPDGRVWLVNYDFGQPAADDGVLAADVAELLTATYVRVGAERAVAAAQEVLGSPPLEQAIVRLVPAALTRRTRGSLKKVDGGVQPLIEQLCRVTGVSEPQLAKVERLKPRYLVMGAMLAVAIYVLLPQLADVPRMVEAVQAADWRWVPAVLVASVLTYVGAGLGLAGATPGRVSIGESGLVSLASSFVATVAPPGVGHVGLNIRYLQKRGFSGPIAVSASAAKEATVLIVHLLLLVVFGLWAGRSGALQEELERLPPAGVLLAIAGALLAVVGVVLLTPRARRVLRETVVPAVRSSVEAMGEVIRSPAKMTMLVAGVTLLPLGYSVCLFFSVEAFAGGVSFAAVALVYLTAGSVAAAAPTPGGVGAVEAVLLAALTGIGIASPEALAAVFLFRFATFWLPIIPGAIAFRWLTARDVI